jgi:flagellar motor protein MotB
MSKKNLKVLMVAIVLVPVALTAYLAKTLYERQGVPEAVESLARQLFKSKEEERQAAEQVRELEKKTEELKTAYDALLAELQGEVDANDVRIRRFQGKIEINFVDKVLFVSGSAEITPRGQTVLGKVGQVLKKVKDRRFFVIGHTDDVPIRSFVFPSNWELSTARASSVIRFLSERHGVDPALFTALGRAFYQPVAANDTPEGRQENRRVEIVIADLPLFEGQGGTEMRSPASAAPNGAGPAGLLESSSPRERDLTLPEAELPKGAPGSEPGVPAGQSDAPPVPGGQDGQVGTPPPAPESSAVPAAPGPPNAPPDTPPSVAPAQAEPVAGAPPAAPETPEAPGTAGTPGVGDVPATPPALPAPPAAPGS